MAYPDMNDLERKTFKQEIVYTCDRIAISLSEGNTNHIGRDCWNSFLGVINKSVRTFVNRMNSNYLQGNFISITFHSLSNHLPFQICLYSCKTISHKHLHLRKCSRKHAIYSLQITFVVSAQRIQDEIDGEEGGNAQLLL